MKTHPTDNVSKFGSDADPYTPYTSDACFRRSDRKSGCATDTSSSTRCRTVFPASVATPAPSPHSPRTSAAPSPSPPPATTAVSATSAPPSPSTTTAPR